MLEGLFGETPGQVEMGSVGWEDEDDFFYPGEETNDGHTLIRVQLFRGRDFTKPISNRAQGRKIICCVADGVIPKKNARCYVGIPNGMDDSPGAGVILAVVSIGNELRRNLAAGDKTFAPAGGQALIIAKTDGSIVLHTTDNNESNGNSIFLKISPKGFHFTSPFGKFILDATGGHWVTKSGARIDMGGIRIPGVPGALADVFSNYVKIQAGIVKAAGGTVYLGQGTYYQPVVSTLPVDTNLLPTGIPTIVGFNPTLVGSGAVWVSSKGP